MQKFTTEQFQENFDELFDRVENGESFIISDKDHGEFMIVPASEFEDLNDVIKSGLTNNDEDELVRIHTDHDEGS